MLGHCVWLDPQRETFTLAIYVGIQIALWTQREPQHCVTFLHKGVYPQSNGRPAIVDIGASKGFVGLWVHLSFAIFAIFDVKRQQQLLEMACDQVQTCLIFPLRWACFPIKIGRNAQWEHLFSMDFNELLTICLFF